MNPALLGILGNLLGDVVGRIWPDPEKKAQAQLELAKLAQSGELAYLNADLSLALGQTTVNTEEAKSTSIFIAGWRPFVGWICGVGLGFQFIIAPLATWGTALAGKAVQFPALDLGTLITLLFGMLGLGAMRSAEKMKGVEGNR